MAYFLFFCIIILGLFNLLRIALFMIASNIHEITEARHKRDSVRVGPTHPWVSVIIPAYNESASIESTVRSVLRNDYPHFEVIVVDDGSTDGTASIVRWLMRLTADKRLKLITQPNGGKSRALNNAMQNQARGSLVMCLDADSRLAPDGISKAVAHFQRDPRLVALASNMKIAGSRGLLGTAQRLEYIMGNRFKRAQALLNIEYIIGGIGSTFRKAELKKIGFYDTDTMTEDIDLTMKILRVLGNKRHKVGYGYDVHTYTQAVPNFTDLIKQRFRWKYGRMQTLYKNRAMLFSSHARRTRLLTFYQLPYAIYTDLMLFLEPLFALFIIVNLLILGNPGIVQWGFLFMTTTVGYVILTSDDDELKLADKCKLLLLAPLSWLTFYVITLVDFWAFMKCLRKLPGLRASLLSESASWDHVERA